MPDRPLMATLLKLIFAFSLANAVGGCASFSENENGGLDPNEPGPYEVTEGQEAGPTVVSYTQYSDPLQVINRPIFTFNHYTYRYLLSPISRGYQKVVPEPVDAGLANFFHNLREPLYFLNNLFQWRPADSGKSVLRLGINSTIGLLGFFDPAKTWWGIEREETNFADTLARYGVGYGAYLVVPILGPSDLRDGSSMTFEYFTHPLRYIAEEREATVLLAADGFRERVPELSRYIDVVAESQDPYLFVRNLYLQGIQRDAEQLRENARTEQSAGDR